MVSLKYTLLIYLPGSIEDVACRLESDQPFMPIARGDLLNPRTWSNRPDDLADVLLRVVGVEHFLCQVEDRVSRHSIGVFTEAVADDEESRR
jgi:hypothetical protein